MNFAFGKIISEKERDELITNLDEKIINSLKGERLDPNLVIEACDFVIKKLSSGEIKNILNQLDISKSLTDYYIIQIKKLFNKNALIQRVEMELGENYLSDFYRKNLKKKILPLGVLLHIPAGNADGLPIFSVIEGLLSGNINILKLPDVDRGITIMLLKLITDKYPIFKKFIYVFDYSSKDTSQMKVLFGVSDAVVVWGGDDAVSSIRSLVKPNTKIIEWGHKISFAYATKDGLSEENLRGLARHIIETNQLLCSSCQGVYLDTDNFKELQDFSKKFLEILDEEHKAFNMSTDIGLKAQIKLQIVTEELNSLYNNNEIYKTENCSITLYRDTNLTTSIMFGNCWAKMLKSSDIIKTLRHHKNHLQTVGLLCSKEEHNILSEILLKIGVTKITSGKNMSAINVEDSHDGEYPLRKYTKVAQIEL